ncbi:23425_t:CDS:2 [Dentiscutata erythropus]|uniref:23425_t:CDS:1 n=1 Tax=Dentiscutata erythropus TaxID=1348616 RepID=A0A9N9E041_9GLOM|nr:23425_t:CDS:2 [Dentiscutata erythropus]
MGTWSRYYGSLFKFMIMNEKQLEEVNTLLLIKSSKDSCDDTTNTETATDSESTIKATSISNVETTSKSEIVKRNPQIPTKLPTTTQTVITSSLRVRRKKNRKKWTEHELNALEAGMEEYGTSWTKIYEKYGNAYGILRDRSQTQLKDKARNEKIRRKSDVKIFENFTLCNRLIEY